MIMCGNLDHFRPTTNKCLRGNEENGSFKRTVLSLYAQHYFFFNPVRVVLFKLKQCFHVTWKFVQIMAALCGYLGSVYVYFPLTKTLKKKKDNLRGRN